MNINNLRDFSESNDFFKFLVENSPDIICILNGELEILYINNAFQELLGFKKLEILGMRFENIVHHKERYQVRRTLKSLSKLNEINRILRCVKKSNDSILVEVKGKSLKFRGEPDDILLTIREKKQDKEEITEKNGEKLRELRHDLTEIQFWKLFQPKKCLAAYRGSQQMLRVVMDNIPQYIIWKDRNLQYLGCNYNFADLIGLEDPNLIIGKTDEEIGWKINEGLIKRERELIELDRSDYHVKEAWSLNEEEELIFDTNRIPLHDQNGSVVGLLITHEDITERVNAEKKISESEQKYRDIAELLPEIIYEADLAMRLTYANSIAFRKFGYTQEDFKRGLYLTDLVDNLEKAKDNFKEIIKGEETKPHEYKLLKKGGGFMYGRIHSRPIFKNGHVAGLRGVIHDITDIKETQLRLKESEQKLKILNKELEAKVMERTKDLRESKERLKEQNKELKKLDQLKNDFITMAAHELKTPLISISGYTEYILMKYGESLDTEIVEDLKIVQRNIERLERYMNQLLDVMKIDEKKLNLQKERVDINEIIRCCIDELAYLIKQKEHSVKYHPVDEIILNVDKERLFQVFSNLLSNAIKFTPNKGIIEIETSKQDDSFTFSVKDNGLGLDINELDHVFNKFDLLKNPGLDEKIDYRGTGIGLYITKGIVEAHGGKISAHSQGKKKGATFTFSLPISN